MAGMVDAFEKHPQLLARWNGGEALGNGIKKSLRYGNLRRILEELEEDKIDIDRTIEKMIDEIGRIHQETHNQ